MISGVHVEVGGKTVVLRLTTRAMIALEDEFNDSVDRIFSSLADSPRISTLAKILAATMNDGKGADLDEASEMIDVLGFEKTGEVLEQAAKKAFPDADAKNPQGAGQKK